MWDPNITLQHTGLVRENTNIFTGRIFRWLIYLQFWSAGLSVSYCASFFFLNWYLPKWEVLSINFESQLLCGRITLCGRTTGTAPPPAPHFRPTLAASLLFPETSHRKPPQLHPFSSPLLPHTQLAVGKRGQPPRPKQTEPEALSGKILNRAHYSLKSKRQNKKNSIDKNLSAVTFSSCS